MRIDITETMRRLQLETNAAPIRGVTSTCPSLSPERRTCVTFVVDVSTGDEPSYVTHEHHLQVDEKTGEKKPFSCDAFQTHYLSDSDLCKHNKRLHEAEQTVRMDISE